MKIPGSYKKFEDYPSRRAVIGILADVWKDYCFILYNFCQQTTEQTEQAAAYANTDPHPHLHLWKTRPSNDLTASYLQFC